MNRLFTIGLLLSPSIFIAGINLGHSEEISLSQSLAKAKTQSLQVVQSALMEKKADWKIGRAHV